VTRALAVSGALGLVLFVTASALADTAPSPWDRAKDPRVGDDWRLHVSVSESLTDRESLSPEARLEIVEARLEEGHAESSPDVRLRFDLGEVYERLKHHQRAIDVLRPALAAAPDHPAATDAWIEIAYAYAYLDRSHEELAAYDAYLARTTSISGRATALLNRAEAEMRLGHLEDAIAGYRDAILESQSVSGVESLVNNEILSRWGLAVALDRSGDATGGAREAAQALQLDLGTPGAWPRGSIIANEKSGVSVFFVPGHEGYYYLGLGMVEHAKQATDPRTAAALWRQAEALWVKYGAGAVIWDKSHKDSPDRWLARAKAHLERARRERASAERRTR